jgi:hypothetical protein
MKPRDLANLLNRAAAALETPDDLSEIELEELIEDLQAEADSLVPKQNPEPCQLHNRIDCTLDPCRPGYIP